MYQLKNLSFKYSKDKVIFQNLELEIDFKKITLISGANGSGKTSLLRILSGLEKKYTGSLLLHNLELSNLNPQAIAKNIIYQKQEPLANIVATTPQEDLAIWLHKYQTQKDDLLQIKSVLEEFEILELIDTPIWKLSGGQTKRVGLAALLINRQKFWLLDEPSSGLDAALQQKLINILISRKKQKLGAIIVTHRLDLFSSIADNIIEIKDQKLI